jgi:lipopolysaccharide transport system permease protein
LLIWRDLRLHYAQTALGVLWVVLQPLATTAMFAIVFGRLAHLPSEGVPYTPFALVGVVLWSFFSSALLGASNSLIEQSNLIKKVYFPRVLLPLAPVCSALLDAAIAFSVTIVVVAMFGMTPSVFVVVALLPSLAIAALTAAGLGSLLGALNLRYRDFRYVIPFLLQVLLFASPVVYSASLVPERWRWLAALNPLTSAISVARWAVLGTPLLSASELAISVASAVALLLLGMLYFRWAERSFADVA